MMCNTMMHHNLDECKLNLPDFVHLNASAVSLTVMFYLNEVKSQNRRKKQTGAFSMYAICYTTY